MSNLHKTRLSPAVSFDNHRVNKEGVSKANKCGLLELLHKVLSKKRGTFCEPKTVRISYQSTQSTSSTSKHHITMWCFNLLSGFPGNLSRHFFSDSPVGHHVMFRFKSLLKLVISILITQFLLNQWWILLLYETVIKTQPHLMKTHCSLFFFLVGSFKLTFLREN